MIKNCVVCGGEFEARTCDKTCSAKCSLEWKRKRHRENARRSYAENPEKYIAYRKSRYLKDPDKYREQSRKWAIRNPEKARSIAKRSYARNPEKHVARARRWYAENREKARETQRAYRKKYMAAVQALNIIGVSL